MDQETRRELLKLSWSMHDEVEQAILKDSTKQGDDNWTEKQKLLLADMSLHLLQTALKPNGLSQEKLKNNLNAILTLSDDFIDEVDLRKTADALYGLDK
ncbi:hypothetical protein L1285_08145 [Pseudoalteromonas sp. DL2-H2.2]|uniref:hypothetical protein n=1 Tax=Pseudoalteromonas sp. DL2-H2.2 TaxID=2908889 RepID=UPI001F2CFDB8|nr:hypothetical protein [Pseudoalteromonas sp. DL2-H2.2]MCF2908293.1 hypothetical protein [Pseudoalteromonas sp. DL2-H2.2]